MNIPGLDIDMISALNAELATLKLKALQTLGALLTDPPSDPARARELRLRATAILRTQFHKSPASAQSARQTRNRTPSPRLTPPPPCAPSHPSTPPTAGHAPQPARDNERQTAARASADDAPDHASAQAVSCRPARPPSGSQNPKRDLSPLLSRDTQRAPPASVRRPTRRAGDLLCRAGAA